jgi:hypothetical protein
MVGPRLGVPLQGGVSPGCGQPGGNPVVHLMIRLAAIHPPAAAQTPSHGHAACLPGTTPGRAERGLLVLYPPVVAQRAGLAGAVAAAAGCKRPG